MPQPKSVNCPRHTR